MATTLGSEPAIPMPAILAAAVEAFLTAEATERTRVAAHGTPAWSMAGRLQAIQLRQAAQARLGGR